MNEQEITAMEEEFAKQLQRCSKELLKTMMDTPQTEAEQALVLDMIAQGRPEEDIFDVLTLVKQKELMKSDDPDKEGQKHGKLNEREFNAFLLLIQAKLMDYPPELVDRMNNEITNEVEFMSLSRMVFLDASEEDLRQAIDKIALSHSA